MSAKLRVIKPLTVTDAMLTSNVAETDYAEWSAATAYTLGQKCIRGSLHKVYERLIAGTSATAPEDDAVNWLDAGPTNRWKMFDQSNTTQTTKAGSLVVSVAPGQVVNSLALLNVDADTVRVQMIDPIDGTVFDQTFNMQAPPTESSFFAYCFDPIKRKTRVTLTNMPNYGSAAITVTLTIATGDAKCGVMVVGRVRQLGAYGVEIGARVGFQDYSRKSRNTYGDYQYKKGANSKNFSVQMKVDNSDLDSMNEFLTGLDGPVVWIGSDVYDALVVYGFLQRSETVFAYTYYLQLSLDVEGLT